MIGAGRPRRGRKFLLLAVSVLATLTSLEVGIRIFDAARGRSWHARTAWYWGFEQAPFVGYRGRANVRIDFGPDGVSRHNGDGFRDDRELAQLDAVPDRRLILCVGESSTYGSGAENAAEAYPARLEAHLRRLTGDPRWHVYNAGVPGYTSYQIVRLLQLRLLKHRPEAVVMMNLRNDVEFVSRRLDEGTDFGDLPLAVAPMRRTFWSELYMRSSLVGLIASRHFGAHVPPGGPTGPLPPPTARGRAFYLDNLAAAALLCRRASTKLLLVDQPVFNDAQHPSRRQALAEMRAALKAASAEHGVPLLEADRPLRDSGFRSPDEVHLGATGYDKLAEILAPRVAEELGAVAPR